MNQYPIPQFIEEEAKIIFFLTFRQFFFLVGGGAICTFLYFVLPFSLFVAGSIVVGLLILGMAFLKINNEPVLKALFHFITFSAGTKNYIWDKKESLYPFKNKPQYEIKNIPDAPIGGIIKESKLSSIKKMVETRK